MAVTEVFTKPLGCSRLLGIGSLQLRSP